MSYEQGSAFKELNPDLESLVETKEDLLLYDVNLIRSGDYFRFIRYTVFTCVVCTCVHFLSFRFAKKVTIVALFEKLDSFKKKFEN